MEYDYNGNPIPINKTNINVPSVKQLVCPHCKSEQLTVLGMQGARGNMFGAMFGGIIVNEAIADNVAQAGYVPLEYKCDECKKKFEAYPFRAMPDEILDFPATVNFHRLSAWTGCAMPQTVWLNGIRIGDVGNKRTLTFTVYTKHNVIFVTDHLGMAFKGKYILEAESSATYEINFKRKFLTDKK